MCPLLPVGTNYGNILIPSERTSIRHAGSTATAGLAIVRKIIYLTKSEILYGECSEGERDTTATELYGVVLYPLLSSSPTLCNQP